MITSDELAALCGDDGEFLLAARHWTGGLRLDVGGHLLALDVHDGVASAGAGAPGPGVVELSGPAEVWERLLAANPARFHNDIAPALGQGLVRSGDRLAYAQYYPAIARVIELLRSHRSGATVQRPAPTRPEAAPRFDSPVGRYVHLDLDGHDHRVYFEAAGTGIPVLLQHTAGAHGSQWRHLFELPDITDHFRLIAYDLPFHGKSLPPTTRDWWSQGYRLTRDFAMSVPLALADALELDRPVFMGCSVGGLLALDLARYHPDAFRAVIALEPALRIDGDLRKVDSFWHPQVGSETKARMMHGLTAPSSPEALRRETAYIYSAGWPPSFIGDLHYYVEDHDLTDEVAAIDTDRIAVHLLTGEYDHSATIEHGAAAHRAITGSTFDVMADIGHFPMSEDPERFTAALLPILDQIRRLTG